MHQGFVATCDNTVAQASAHVFDGASELGSLSQHLGNNQITPWGEDTTEGITLTPYLYFKVIFEPGPTNPVRGVVKFGAAYPPSLQLFITMIQTQHGELREQDITGIYVDMGGKWAVVSEGMKGGVAWNIAVKDLLNKAGRVRVFVKTPQKVYNSFIKGCLD